MWYLLRNVESITELVYKTLRKLWLLTLLKKIFFHVFTFLYVFIFLHTFLSAPNTNTTSGIQIQILYQIYCCIGHRHRRTSPHFYSNIFIQSTHNTIFLYSFIDHIYVLEIMKAWWCCCYNLRFFTLLLWEKQKQELLAKKG